MLSPKERQLMEVLNNRIQKEQDSEKLLVLVELLNTVAQRAEERATAIRKSASVTAA